jgi:hypothetical protein
MPIELGVIFEEMRPATAEPAAGYAGRLDIFAACLGKRDLPLACTDDVRAGTEAVPGKDRGYALCPGELGRLDMVVRGPERGSEGRYAGELRLVSRPASPGGRAC